MLSFGYNLCLDQKNGENVARLVVGQRKNIMEIGNQLAISGGALGH